MTPHVRMTAVNADDTAEDIVARATTTGHSRHLTLNAVANSVLAFSSRVLLAPLTRELDEAFLRRGLGECCDRAEIPYNSSQHCRIPRKVLRIQVHDAGLAHRQGPDGVDGLGKALEPIADRDVEVSTPRFLISVSPRARTLPLHRRPQPTARGCRAPPSFEWQMSNQRQRGPSSSTVMPPVMVGVLWTFPASSCSTRAVTGSTTR